MILSGSYYVYKHVDPFTQNTMYIGKGTKERAWMVTNRRKKNPDHYNWLCDLLGVGFLSPDWVVILANKLDNASAVKLETEFIKINDYPLFNRFIGERSHFAKLTDDDVLEIRRLKSTGVTNKNIAALFDVSSTQISNIVRGAAWTHLLDTKVDLSDIVRD